MAAGGVGLTDRPHRPDGWTFTSLIRPKAYVPRLVYRRHCRRPSQPTPPAPMTAPGPASRWPARLATGL